MTEYTYEDIIIDPTSDRAKEAVGKEVYFFFNPSQVLERANEDYSETGVLVEIQYEKVSPFLIRSNIGFDASWSCIIVKKEESNHEYVPFESASEFLYAYEESNQKCKQSNECILSRNGIWLRCKKGFHCNKEPYSALAMEIYDDCVTVGSYPDPLTYKGLLDHCEFLDGSPCGKKVQ